MRTTKTMTVNGVWGGQTSDETVDKEEFEDDKDDDSEWCLVWTDVG